MKTLIVLTCVIISQATVIRNRVTDLPAPRLVRLTTLNPRGIGVTWEPVYSPSSNPVVGYKVKVWEQQTGIVYEYIMIDGVLQLVEREVLVPFPSGIPDWTPKEVSVHGVTTSSAQFYLVKPEYTYEVRVQAVTSRGEGPLSNAMRIRFEDRYL
ncbi:hypothetical protein evm_010304 [Chilo suppressalis]|nr:hypothetical protein evm_010304 [Chilo suppressalis]